MCFVEDHFSFAKTKTYLQNEHLPTLKFYEQNKYWKRQSAQHRKTAYFRNVFAVQFSAAFRHCHSKSHQDEELNERTNEK